MSKLTKALTAAAGNAGAGALYVEDVFSTYLYDGNGSTQTITNGIDLAGEGGMVWTKERSPTGRNHFIGDSERDNFARYVYPDLTSQQTPVTNPAYDITSVSSTGYSLGPNNYTWNNESGSDQVSWTFRKAEKFFDVQTWTGNSTAGRTIAHNLGSAPAFVLVKRTSATNNWICWHSGIAITKYLQINSTSPAYNDGGIFWDSTLPDASNITLGSDSGVNATGSTYVAYLFASDAGGFGDDGDENIIKCGSVTTGNASTDVEVDLGFEPQWILMKNSGATSQWFLVDTMRGWVSPTGVTNQAKPLFANLSNTESSGTNFVKPTATGFTVVSDNLGTAQNWIYIAIRRPMKTPEAGTEVFAMDTLGSTGDGNAPSYRSPFPVDMGLQTSLTGNQRQISTRLLQGTELLTESTAAEAASASKQFDYMNGTGTSTATNSVNMMWMFKRATGFMDVVAYTGTGSAHTEAHNLGVVPEMMIIKPRSLAYQWSVWNKDIASSSPYYEIVLNLSEAQTDANNTNAPFSGLPTDTGFSLPSGTASASNRIGYTYIAYLFATLAGVSKVGSYTGTGSNVNVDCGFSAGARFILIKRTDSTGDWYVYDSLRGIVAGNDPYFFLNNTAAQVTNTDYVDPLASGFTVTSSAPAGLNASGGSYIFLAIA
jgi:hypothetical protein